MESVTFYYEYEENGYLSNYFEVKLKIDGREWNSVEHYYQAQKAVDGEIAQKIQNAPTCDDAKKLGNAGDFEIRPDWDGWKVVAMMKALRAKFTQHADLRERLLATGGRVLAENSQKDYYWGIGADGSGKSMLGKLLMELREDLRNGVYAI